ncbi:hypothetical protein D3C81_1303890 [compost metagenome]
MESRLIPLFFYTPFAYLGPLGWCFCNNCLYFLQSGQLTGELHIQIINDPQLSKHLLIKFHEHEQTADRHLSMQNQQAADEIEIHPGDEEILECLQCPVAEPIHMLPEKGLTDVMPVLGKLERYPFLHMIRFDLTPALNRSLQPAFVLAIDIAIPFSRFPCTFTQFLSNPKGNGYHQQTE